MILVLCKDEKDHGEFLSKRFFGNHWSKCPKCEEKRIAEENKAEIERSKSLAIQKNLSQSGIPKRFLDTNFENYIADTEGKVFAREAARSFASKLPHFSENRDANVLVFAGNVGTGKGHLAAAVCKEVINQGHSAYFATAREIILMLRASWNDRLAASELEVLRMLTTVSILVIDEVGVQFNSDAERDQLFGVIDGRYREMMPIIFTTNLTTSDFRKALGDRSFSRLREEGKWIPFDWEDYRISP